jgi:hypothetical protein
MDVRAESLVEDAVDVLVAQVYAEAEKLDGPTHEVAELIARRVAERFGIDA